MLRIFKMDFIFKMIVVSVISLVAVIGLFSVQAQAASEAVEDPETEEDLGIPEDPETGLPLIGEEKGTSGDGTVITSTLTNFSISSDVNLVAAPEDDQLITFDSSAASQADEVSLLLSADLLAELVAAYGSINNILASIYVLPASSEELADEVMPEGFALLGNDIYAITISAASGEVNYFENYFIVSFDITGIDRPNDLRIGYFNEAENKWSLLAGTLAGNILSVSVNYTGHFALFRKEMVSERDQEILNVMIEAGLVHNSGVDLSSLLFYNGQSANQEEEQAARERYTNRLMIGLSNIGETQAAAFDNFIFYGTRLTKILGAGERAGVLNSYKSAFGKLPQTESEWADAIKISIGRWPTARSQKMENTAINNFQKIYLRLPNRSNPYDDAAVTVMAYGLRPAKRSLDSERAAIDIFKAIYGYYPELASAWDMARAIAYSGATR